MTDRVRQALQDALGPSVLLQAELSGGGMSRVFAAHDTSLGRGVVVKVLAPELAHDLSSERFALEIRTTAALQNPHIVPVLAAGMTSSGLPFYTMPLVRGESLAIRLDRAGALSTHETLVVLRDIARALAGAHAQGIVHRDIKPANVLITGGTDGAAPLTAMVTDFGIAKALAASALFRDRSAASLTVAGGTPGTPAYMSPEQVASDVLDHRTDLYSFGILAYEVCCGLHPFAGHSSARALLIAHLTERPRPLTEVAPGVPPGVAALVMQCLEKSPADRPASAGELLSALDAAFQGSGAPARRRVVERGMPISETVARTLDRATLDPRIIGSTLQYLENDGRSDVLLYCVHGLGHDASEFAPLLEVTPYRALSVTLHGFEPRAPLRVPLAMGAHLGLLQALLCDAVGRIRPQTVVLVGFSSGGDMVLRLLAEQKTPSQSSMPQVDACLALGPNVSIATCFASRLFARLPDARRMHSDADDGIRGLLADLKRLGESATDLDEWLHVMTYQMHSLRKFRADIAPLRRLSEDVVAPFEKTAPSEPDVFARWFRAASARTSVLRCVFERSPAYEELIPALKFRNLDGDVLGLRYTEDSLVFEPTTDHFALLAPALITRHVEALLATIRR